MLGAVLKEHGHHAEVFIEMGTRNLMKAVADANPTLIAFSTMTGDHVWTASTAMRCKAQFPHVPVIAGGPHPTYFPEFIQSPGIDFICRGEGEGAIVDLVEVLDSGSDATKIPNIWTKRDGTVFENAPRPYVDPLDALPFADRSLYFGKHSLLGNDRVFSVMVARGCPMKCSYCFNAAWNDLYRGKGRHARLRSVEHAIGELVRIKEEYAPPLFYFVDDLFGTDAVWLSAFFDRYSEVVDIPFACNNHVRFITEEWVEQISRSRCRCVAFGIESGNQEIRERVLNRHYSNEEIVEVAKRLHRHGVPFMTYNILGSPGETLEQAFETIGLNTRIKTDFFHVSLCQPYPGTRLYADAVAGGFIQQTDRDFFPASFFFTSVLKQPEIERIINLQRLYLPAIRFPRLRFLVRWLIKLPPNPIFSAIYLLSLGIPYARRTNRGLVRTFLLGWRNFGFWRS